MPNDAKLGLAVGVGLVICIAVAYYRTESVAAPANPAATIDKQEADAPPEPPLRKAERTPATSTARAESDVPAKPASRRTVREADAVPPETDEQP
jgi:hypothetical protein